MTALSRKLPIVACLVLLTFSSCKPAKTTSNAAPSSKTRQVYVTNYPLEFFAKRIFGDEAEVHFPAPENEDPSFWNPAPEVIEKYQAADLILINGATYEKWIEL